MRKQPLVADPRTGMCNDQEGFSLESYLCIIAAALGSCTDGRFCDSMLLTVGTSFGYYKLLSVVESDLPIRRMVFQGSKIHNA